MDMMAEGYEKLTRHFVDWAQKEEDIRAAIVIGSRVRVDHPADEWSDLDVIIFTTNPPRYIASAEWVRPIGDAWLTFCERTPDGGWERRAIFGDGYDVDLAIMPAETLESMASGGLPPIWVDVLRRGMRVLLDKDGAITRIKSMPLPEPTAYQPPSNAEFLAVVNDFWYHAIWTAKHLRRGELWWAKSGCDDRLKALLRQALEWQAHAAVGAGQDTWMRGRFLEEWADPHAVKDLADVFAHYDREDIARAMFKTMDLFRRLAVEVAQRLGYAYPDAADRSATALVRKYLGRDES